MTDTTDTRTRILVTGQKIMASRGYSGVGLTEILTGASVPKGSFYHYFGSKDAFGEAVLASYFEAYHAEMDEIFSRPGIGSADRLMRYFATWRETQGADECQGRCLAVKLGAEVSDLSEPMRLALKAGTNGIVLRLARAIEAGVVDGSLTVAAAPTDVAATLYNLWLGASVMAKIVRSSDPFDVATKASRQLLGL